MRKVIIVTGIDTDIGKTYFTGQLIGELLDYANAQITSYKPVQTGDLRTSQDLTTQHRIAGEILSERKRSYKLEKWLSPLDCCSYIYPQAVSPHYAANLTQDYLSPSKILWDFINLLTQNIMPHRQSLFNINELSHLNLEAKPWSTKTTLEVTNYLQTQVKDQILKHRDCTVPTASNSFNIQNDSLCSEQLQERQAIIIELAGGVFSPVNDTINNLDLIKLLKQTSEMLDVQCEIVLVTSGKLGSISSTLSSLMALPPINYLCYNEHIIGGTPELEEQIARNNLEFYYNLQLIARGLSRTEDLLTNLPHHERLLTEQFLMQDSEWANMPNFLITGISPSYKQFKLQTLKIISFNQHIPFQAINELTRFENTISAYDNLPCAY